MIGQEEKEMIRDNSLSLIAADMKSAKIKNQINLDVIV